MTNNNFSSLELSKKLKEARFEMVSEYIWGIDSQKLPELIRKKIARQFPYDIEYPAYDILNDICCKYAKEFFPTTNNNVQTRATQPFLLIPYQILALMQMGDKEGAEKLIWDTCKFNPKNK